MKRLVGVFLMAGLMIHAVSGSAYCHHWDLTGRGDWSVDDNWRYNEPISTTNTAVEWGNPVVTQAGEVAQIIRLSGSYGNNPILEIASGDLSVGEFLSLGYFQDTVGSLVMTGGKLTVPQLKVAQSTGSSASLDISGGILEAGYIVAGWGGGSSLVQTGGEIHTPELKIHNYYSNDNDSIYEFSGGVLNVGMLDIMSNGVDGDGYFDIQSDAVDMTVWDAFNLQEGGRFTSVPGVTITFEKSGRFNILSTSYAQVSGIENLALKYKNLMPFSGSIEAAGEDRGAVLAGFVDNFVPESMTLASDTHVHVVNENDNHPGVSAPDVLYVRDIVMSKGSVLTLNGNDVYCECFLNMNATVDDSAGGTLTFLDECHQFDIAADPDRISPDGTSTSELTVTLINDHVPLSGELIYLSTDMGTLTSGGVTGQFVSGTTDGNGEVVVTLTSDTLEGTATILAKADSLDWTTSGTVEMKPLELTVTPGDISYTMIPGQNFGETRTSTMAPSGNPEVTLYGITEVLLDIQLGSPGNSNVIGRTLYLESAEQLAVGTSYIDFPASVVTDADGRAQITVLVEKLDQAAPEFSTIQVQVELAGEPMVYSSALIDVRDNRQTILSLYEGNIQTGPVLEQALWDYLDSISGAGNIVNQTLRKAMQFNPYMAGSVNNLLSSHTSLPNNMSSRMSNCICGTYQTDVLKLLDALRENRTSGGTTDWLFNGLDYGPIHVIGAGHVAAMIYPRLANGYEEWKYGDTLVLDPWMTQSPVGAYYPLNQWSDICSLALLSIIHPAIIYTTISPYSYANTYLNGYYPANNKPYPLADPHQLPLYDPAATLLVDCPVYVTVEDASGNITGFQEPPDEQTSPLVWENTDILFSQFQRPDNTFLWEFAIPDQPVTVKVKGYDQGGVHLIVSDHAGEFYVYTAGQIQQDQVAVIALDPAAAGMVPMVYDDGSMVLPDNLVGLAYTEYDPVQGMTRAVLTVSNQSDIGIFGPLRLEVSGINPASIMLASPDGTSVEGYPYVGLTGLLTGNVLQPGQVITTDIWFSNTGNQRFDVSGRLKGFSQTGQTILAGLSDRELGYLQNWAMKQKDMHQTGRADFIVPAWKLNDSFFDTISWQNPPPGGENDGNTGGTSMTFFDGAGPNSTDIVLGTYHWPKGIQGMDRHTGEILWTGNPDDGGEEIAEITPAFSNSGSTVYVSNRYTANSNPLMAFETLTGPSVFRHNGMEASPDNLGYGSPIIDTAGRIFMHGYYDRPRAGTDTGSAISETWTAAVGTGTLKSEVAMFQGGDLLKVIGTGRYGNVNCYDGVTGALLWSVAMGQMTDASPTIDPASGNIYISSGDHDIYVTGLDKDGNLLWSQAAVQLYDWEEDVNNRQRALSAGCLSHDGTTYYFQTTSEQGDGKLYAVNTADGSLKWAFDTQSMGGESWNHYFSSPIVTRNKVIIIGNNEGDRYYAVQDSGTYGRLLDILQVDESGNARASATMDSFGQLYLPVRTVWTAGNGNGDVPDGSIRNLFTAFDIQSKQPVPDLSVLAREFGKMQQISPGDLDQDLDVDGKDIGRFVSNY